MPKDAPVCDATASPLATSAPGGAEGPPATGLDAWADATAQAAAVRARAVSARELATAAIARIEALNPALNAVIHTRFEAALAAADAIDADADLRAAPFAGAPTLIKDLAELADAPLTFGSRLFRDYVAKSDEPIVVCFKRAGFVPLGKTNTPEFGLIGTTEPLLHGPTRNPWDHALSPGGSSGGAAAAVAAGLAAVAQASDGGGSIRIPAAACGVFGLKPSRGRGVAPKREGFGGLGVTFCVSRSVRDSARLLAASDAMRAAAERGGPPPIAAIDGPAPRRLRIALAQESFTGAQPDAETRAAVESSARLCASLGHEVEIAAPALDGPSAVDHFLALWSAVPSAVAKNFQLARWIGAGFRPWALPSFEAALDPWSRALAARFDRIERERPGQIARAEAFFERQRLIYEAFFDRFDVILSPVTRRARLPLGEQAPDTPFELLLESAIDNVGYTPAQNALGAPAMSMPLGWGAGGAPIGVQFAARRFDEATLLGLAFELEAARPWADRRPRET